MTIVLSCPGCGKKYELDGGLAGKKARCRKCAVEFRIPEPSQMDPAERPPDPGDTLPATPAPPAPTTPPSPEEETIVDPDLGYVVSQPPAEAAASEPAPVSEGHPPATEKKPGSRWKLPWFVLLIAGPALLGRPEPVGAIHDRVAFASVGRTVDLPRQ